MLEQIAAPGNDTHAIRSFVRRTGRITKGQKKALNKFWHQYVIDIEPGVLINFDLIFPNKAPVWLEIGYGNGESLITMAKNHAEINFIGIEVYLPGVGHALKRIADENLSNIRLICADAVKILENQLKKQCLDRLMLFFPDPWPKKRHHKRRIVQPEFVRLVQANLKAGGIFHMATDWEAYAFSAMEILAAEPGFKNLSDDGLFMERANYRPLTKFEQRGIRLGHCVRDLMYQRL